MHKGSQMERKQNHFVIFVIPFVYLVLNNRSSFIIA